MDPSTEYDAAWKATLETFLHPCLSLAFPRLADQIDWSAPPRFLDTELQEIVRDSEGGPMRVDKLVEVMRLIHWLLALPEEEELRLRKDVKQMEASMQTKRRSTYERIVWEEGLVAGREQGRYDAMREGLRARVQSIQDESELRQLGRAILKVSTLDEFEARAGANPQSGI